MKLEFYHTVLCPRCLYAAHELKKISTEFPELEIENIEITLNLTRTRAAAIRFVPAIKIGEDVLTGIILTPTKIRQFIKKHISSK
jgi:predicted DsbA family dithiol-disulfide isomerase